MTLAFTKVAIDPGLIPKTSSCYGVWGGGSCIDLVMGIGMVWGSSSVDVHNIQIMVNYRDCQTAGISYALPSLTSQTL